MASKQIGFDIETPDVCPGESDNYMLLWDDNECEIFSRESVQARVGQFPGNNSPIPDEQSKQLYLLPSGKFF
jgi:hypothetical protein